MVHGHSVAEKCSFASLPAPTPWMGVERVMKADNAAESIRVGREGDESIPTSILVIRSAARHETRFPPILASDERPICAPWILA